MTKNKSDNIDNARAVIINLGIIFMEIVQGIFSQLGIDSSFFIQFVIIMLVFILSKYVFLQKLQFVIEFREDKTTKLEKGAEKVLEEAAELSEKYYGLIEDAHQKANNKFDEKRKEILQRENEALKSTEVELANFIQNAKNDFQDEIEKKKKLIFSNVESLANLLVSKISK